MLDRVVKDYDKNIMLMNCQRQAFEYLFEEKGEACPWVMERALIINHLLQKVLKKTPVFLWTISPFKYINKTD